ncbi:MAG TPA: hypothetical protein VGK64_27820 [Bryobacteraceae bacterium]
MTPEAWIKLLYLYGPVALFAFMVFVLLRIAGNTTGLNKDQQRIQTVAYLAVWISIFILGALIVVVYWRVNFPHEYEIRGFIHDLRDPETISTADNLFLRRIYKTASNIDYEWRIISSSRPTEPVEFLLQASPSAHESTRYKIPVLDHTPHGTVEITYDRTSKTMTLVDGDYHSVMNPELISSIVSPAKKKESAGIVYADSTPPASELVKALDSNDPIIRQNAKRDLISQGRAALDTVDKARRDSRSSKRLQIETLAVLDRVVGVKEIKQSGWRPIDLASGSKPGVIVLSNDGRVSKVEIDSTDVHLRDVFRVPTGFEAASIAEDDDAIYVAARSQRGCVVFRYLASTGQTSSKTASPDKECHSIASSGNAFYIAGGGTNNEIWSFSDWDAKRLGQMSLPGLTDASVLHFDRDRLLVGDHAEGSLYSVSLPDFKAAKLASNLGWINSLTSDNSRILVASGKKVLVLDRQSGKGQNPPSGLKALKGGIVSGVAVDMAGSLWISDYDRESIMGPIPLD